MPLLIAARTPPITPPTIAAAFGFNTRTFTADFSNLNRIDINNTGTSTASTDWWTANPYEPYIVPAGNFSTSAGVLTISQGAGGTIGHNTPSISTIYLPTHAHTALTWSGGTATATTAEPHNYSTGDQILIKFVASTNDTINGYRIVTVTDSTHYTFSASDPGTITVVGQGTTDFARWRGRCWKNGYLRRVTFAFDESISANGMGFPSFWGESFPGATSADNVENDAFDCKPSNGSVSLLSIYHHWAAPGQQVDTLTEFNIALRATIGNPVLNGTNFFSVDELWVPSYKNGGTGIFRTYFTNAGTTYHMPEYDLDYSPTGLATPTPSPANFVGAFAVCETASNPNGFPFFITCGNTPGPADWPLKISEVSFWQSSTSDMVVV